MLSIFSQRFAIACNHCQSVKSLPPAVAGGNDRLKRWTGRAARVFGAGLVCLSLAASHAWAKGELSAKEARRLITRVAGAELPGGAVRIKTISPSRGAAGAETVALAEIETVFRFESGDDDRWRIAEIRTGSDRWEDISLMARAGGVETTSSAETRAMVAARSVAALDAGRAREMIARLFDVQLPSDAVRVKELSSLYTSAVVVARITAEFRFSRGSDNKWRVSHVRAGDGEWKDVESIVHAVNTEKARRARSELEMMVAALDAFRRERGFYPVADSSGRLVDQLNPRYLPRVIRLDPWHKPYLYEGERDRYVLRSGGADGEPGTADDINVAGH